MNKFRSKKILLGWTLSIYSGLDCETPIRCGTAIPAFILWAPHKKPTMWKLLRHKCFTYIMQVGILFKLWQLKIWHFNCKFDSYKHCYLNLKNNDDSSKKLQMGVATKFWFCEIKTLRETCWQLEAVCFFPPDLSLRGSGEDCFYLSCQHYCWCKKIHIHPFAQSLLNLTGIWIATANDIDSPSHHNRTGTLQSVTTVHRILLFAFAQTNITG